MIRHSADKVGNYIVKLKNESDSLKKDEHLYLIPRKADDLLEEQVFVYYGSDRKRTIFNPAKSVCIELNAVKFFPMLARSYKRLQDSNTPVIDLIEHQKIYPFALFLNGRFIPWEYINLITSFGKYYFFIHDLPSIKLTKAVRTVDDMSLLILPTHMIYSIGVENTEYRQLFAFNSMGELDFDEWTHCIYYPTDKVDINRGLVHYDECVTGFDSRYVHDNNTFFFWNEDGLYAPDSSFVFAGDVAYGNIDSDTNMYVYISNNKTSFTVNNISKVESAVVEDDIISMLKREKNVPEYIKNLSKPFELKMDRNLSYTQNRANAIKYILQYRTDLFHKLYEMHLDFFTISIDYNWMLAHRDEDGYFNIPRRSSGGLDYYVIIMTNGELYNYYMHHFYDNNRFVCPISGIENGDEIELLFFKNADNFNFNITVSENDEYQPLNHRYFNNDTILFCKETSDTYFEFPADGNQHFPVPYMYESDENGNRKIIIDSFYHGKELIVSSDQMFRYYGFFVDEEEAQYYKINLGDKFYCCNNYDRYLVFYNGRRLSNDQYRLTVPCRTTTPFFEFEIYLTVPLTYHDRLDIFYLPNTIRDIDAAIDINEDGTMLFTKKLLEYLAGSSLYTFWVNGKKIPLSSMKDVDSLTIQLTKDIESLKHAKIIKMGNGIDEIETIYQSINSSIWDKVIADHPDRNALLNIIPSNITDKEPDTYVGSVPITSIMLELVREHYLMNARVDTTAPFVYDYLDQDTTLVETYDNTGNALIEVADAERTDNLDIERNS